MDIFTRSEYCDEIISNLNYCIENKGLKIYAFCVMPSHLHMVAEVSEGALSDVLRDFKGYTAKKIIEMITQNERESRKEWLLYLFRYFTKLKKNKSNHQFWQHNNHPIDILSGKWLEEKIAYIHENPVKARIVDEPDHYMYSSAYPGTTLRLEAWK